MEQQRIGLLDDQIERCAQLRAILETSGFSVVVGCPDVSIHHILVDGPFAVLILGLPRVPDEALARCRSVRSCVTIPILIVTDPIPSALIAALIEWGADDYLVNPCNEADVLARVYGLMHSRACPTQRLQIGAGTVMLDQQSKQVYVRGVLQNMTPKEYALLLHLMQHAGTPIPYDCLIHTLAGPIVVHDRSYLTVYIWHLRQKLEIDPRHPQLIVEVVGVGYQLMP